MKKLPFNIKKMTARAFVAIGAALGLTSCFHGKNSPGQIEAVYGPPPGSEPDIQVVEDVYGPPMEYSDTAPDGTAVKPELLPNKRDTLSKKK